jgi:HK97 family phage major capsid protein
MENVEKLLQEQKEAFDSLKAGLSELKGSDAKTNEKIEKANKALTDLQAKIDASEEAQRKRADEIEAKMNRIGLNPDEKKRDLRDDALKFYAAKAKEPVKSVTSDQVKQYGEYCNAFHQYVRAGGANGEMLDSDIRNALKVGSDPDGGYWVPATASTKIIQRLFETSPMRSVADIMVIGTDRLELPKDVNEGTSGGWVGETQSRTETATPQTGTHVIPAHEQYAEPRATQKLLDDAVVDVESWLSAKIADILTRTENTAFVSGTGVSKPRGFLDYGSAATATDDSGRAWGILQLVNTGTSGGFGEFDSTNADNVGPLIDIVHKVKGAYRQGAVWTMNRNTLAEVRKLRDGNGNLIWQPSLQVGNPNTLLGFPIVEFEDMADIAADSLSIAFGNFRIGYQIVDRFGIRVLRDPYTSKPFVKFYTTKRVGGDVINFDAIKLLKFAA